MARRGMAAREERPPGEVPMVVAPEAAVPSCRACAYYHGGERGGDCHRYPPPTDYLPPRMPQTLPTLWCGEFRAKS